MEIVDLSIYTGRNIYSHRPVMKMTVDLGAYGDVPTKGIKGFNEKLLKAFPGLKKNCCGLGYEGGFLDRLNEGTYLAHVLEHTILEMQFMLGYDVSFGKTRAIKEPSVYYLIYEYQNEVCGLECGKAAVFILNCFINGESLDTGEFIDYLKKVSIDAELGPSTTAIAEEAKKRGIPITRIGHESLIQLGYGKNSRVIESTLTDATSCISADMSSNKQLTKTVLSENKIPVPYGKVVYSEISAFMTAMQIGEPVVIKPFDGNQGKGVHLNLKTEEDIKEAYKEASKYSNGVIVEKYVTGKDYRILVVGDKVVAAAERLSASVTGDGSHNIKELIDIINKDEKRGDQHEKPLTKIKLDAVAMNVLKKKGINADYIPEKGEMIPLRENGNLSTGGTAIDCTDNLHPDNAELAVRAANAIGIDIAGIDIVADDITKPIIENGGAIVEVNTAPGIRMHLYPSEGKPRNVAKDIVDLLFPDKASAEFPIVSVTGTNGKTTTVRLISHVLQTIGKQVGMTSTSGTFINNKCICKGDNSGAISAKTLLSNKNIDAAVLETARGGIISRGLGYDLADIGVITNISEDHLGLDGIDTLEDLAFVKSLVVEAVKKDGVAILNADDKMTPLILQRIKSRIILFGMSKNSFKNMPEAVYVYCDNGFIKIQDNDQTINLMKIKDVPITAKGFIDCNIQNSLAAVAALYGLNIAPEVIAAGLNTFEENNGRFNMFDMNGYKVMLDYGHNQAGYESVLKTVSKIPHSRLVGIIGMPGDRQSEAMQKVGFLCANSFDMLYIKEDEDLRGRKQGEVADIFYKSIIKTGFDENNLQIIVKEQEALQTALIQAEPGDLIVMFYEKLEPLIKIIKSFQQPEVKNIAKQVS